MMMIIIKKIVITMMITITIMIIHNVDSNGNDKYNFFNVINFIIPIIFIIILAIIIAKFFLMISIHHYYLPYHEYYHLQLSLSSSLCTTMCIVSTITIIIMHHSIMYYVCFMIIIRLTISFPETESGVTNEWKEKVFLIIYWSNIHTRNNGNKLSNYVCNERKINPHQYKPVSSAQKSFIVPGAKFLNGEWLLTYINDPY